MQRNPESEEAFDDALCDAMMQVLALHADAGAVWHGSREGAPRAVVLGGGVSGLCTALLLLAHGIRVRIVASHFATETTSAAAAAVWEPFMAEDERIVAWCEESFTILRELMTRWVALEDPPATSHSYPAISDDSRCPLRWLPGRSYATADAPDDMLHPPWRHVVRDCRVVQRNADPGPSPGQLPRPAWPEHPRYVAALQYGTILMHTPKLLPLLLRAVTRAGAQLERRRFHLGSQGSLSALVETDSDLAAADVVVNCLGMGARELVPDPSVIPVWGQIVFMQRKGHPLENTLNEFVFTSQVDNDRLTYIIPRPDGIVLGGCVVRGKEGRVVDPATSQAILKRCSALIPGLERGRILKTYSDARPYREGGIRLQRDEHNPKLVHLYGHGGGGWTLSWGCAKEAAAVAARVASQRTQRSML